MIRKAIIFTRSFDPPEELIEFCKSIGYDIINRSWIIFDERIIEFCEKNLSELWDEKVYKGRKNYNYKIGFAGAGYIREIDTSKQWIITYNRVNAPIITYVTIDVDEYGYVRIYEESETIKS